MFTRFKAIWPGDYSTFTQAAPFLPRLLLPCPVLVCLLKPRLLMGKKWSHYVVPQGPRRPPMMTFREATSEGQSDDTQVKGMQLRAGSSYKQDSQQWHCMRTPPPGAQSPPEGLPRARGQGTACWKGDAPRPRRAPQRTGDCTRADRVTGAQEGPTALGGLFQNCIYNSGSHWKTVFMF